MRWRMRSVCWIALGWMVCVGLAAETDPAFKAARLEFNLKIRKKDPAERAAAVTSLVAFPTKESADLILKRALVDQAPEVREATRAALRELAQHPEPRRFLLEDFKRVFRQGVAVERCVEVLRPLVVTQDEAEQAELLKVLDDCLIAGRGQILVPMTIIDEFALQNDAEAFGVITLLAKSKVFETKFGYQRCVIQGLKKLELPEAVTYLILHIPKAQGLVQYDVIQYLTKLTKQKFGDNDREWYHWWQLNEETFKFPPDGVPIEDVDLNDGKPTYYGIPVCAKRMVFVLDTSSSMRGVPIDAAKQALIQVIDKLPEIVSFDIVFFDRNVTVWQPQLVPATTDARLEATRAISYRQTNGRTASFAALDAAFALEPEVIYFLSDGQPTDATPDQIYQTVSMLNRTRRLSIYTIGVVTGNGNGDELTQFMKPLAEKNYGNYRLADPR